MSGERSGDSLHIRHATNHPHDTREMLAVVHLQFEDELRSVGVTLFHRDTVDVGVSAGNRSGNGSENTRAVRDFDAHLGAEVAIRRCLPRHREPLLRMLAVVLNVHAVLAVNDDPAAR